MTVDAAQRARRSRFTGFPGGDFTTVLDDERRPHDRGRPAGSEIKAYLGGRDDAFFNDLPGFFRSINYAPQFYDVPQAMTQDVRELPIPKTLLELEGNTCSTTTRRSPDHGRGREDGPAAGPADVGGRPASPRTRDGNYRFVYSGEDAQAGPQRQRDRPRGAARVPHRRTRTSDRVVNVLGRELGAQGRQQDRDDPRRPTVDREPAWRCSRRRRLDDELRRYKLVDTVGQPFADAGLSEREDNRQLGANNFWLAPTFVKRLAHLGWGFGPSITALGLRCVVRPRRLAGVGAQERTPPR